MTFEIKSLEHRTVGFVTDTSDHCQLQARNDCDSVRPRSGIKHGARFQRMSVDPSQSGCSAICYENLAFIGDDASRFRKAVQCREMAAGFMIDHLHAVPSRMCDKNATTPRLKSAVVE
jgi:hypothetical protein